MKQVAKGTSMSDYIKLQLKNLEKELKTPFPKEFKSLLENIENGISKFVQVNFIAPSDPFKTEKPRFEFQFRQADASSLLVLECEWQASIEEQLYQLHIKVSSLEQEAMRGGTLLLSNLRTADILWGKDYVDSVLWSVVSDRFEGVQVIQDLKQEFSHNKPYDSTHRIECMNYLKSSVNGFGNSLVLQLQYDDKTAYRILVGAVVYMLDRRFNISLRKTLFPKKY